MSNPVYSSLQELLEKALAQTPLGYFEQEYDPQWTSPCEFGGPDRQGKILWKPVPRQEPLDFSGLEHALELTLHADIKAYYSSFFSGMINSTSKEGRVCLIQLWNDADFDRLIENLIGHAIAKKRLNHPYTAFFATTEEDSEYFLSIDNNSGKILLEEPGRKPLKEVDSDISSFLQRLTPAS